MSDAPETNALSERLNAEPWLDASTKCSELYDHACRLERERNTSRKERDMRIKQLDKALRERDEAREMLVGIRDHLHSIHFTDLPKGEWEWEIQDNE